MIYDRSMHDRSDDCSNGRSIDDRSIDDRSILVGPSGVRQIFEFIVENPKGVTISSVTTRFRLASEETIRAALSILEEQGRIRATDEETILPVRA